MQKKSTGKIIFWWVFIIIAVRVLLFSVPVLINEYIQQKGGDSELILTLTVGAFLCLILGIKKTCQFSKKKVLSWRSILIIDDDETQIKTVRSILIAEGFSVLAAPTGEAGLQIAQKQKPDLILLDVILPGIKGREVCKELKNMEETKDIPVIFFTAKDSPDDVQAEKEAGASGHLTKPVHKQLLLSTIQSVLKS